VNRIAIKMLVGDRLKYLSLVAGLSFASLLIVQQGSIFTGFAARMGAWIGDTDVADLWVMDDQVNFVDDFKPVPEDRLQRVRGLDGVAWAVPLYKNYLPVQLRDGTVVLCRVVGLDDATLTGGPPEMAAGTLADLRRDRAVLVNVDQAATTLRARRSDDHPLAVGEHLSVNDNDAVVVGTYRATKEFFWDPVLYTTYSRALSWAPRQRKLLTFVLVKARPGTDLDALAAQVKRTTGLTALTSREFARRSTVDLLGRTGILINFGITIALGFLIGALIAGQTFYMFVLDNLRHFGALKAMGASNTTIARMIFLQTAVAGLVAYGVGLAAACVSGLIAPHVGLAYRMAWPVPVAGLFAILFCCGLAAGLSLIRIVRLEPAVVFKG
jgi:putative ABC transport system permease protein